MIIQRVESFESRLITKGTLVMFQESASFPVKGIHYLNTNAVLDKLVAFVKPFLRSNISDVVSVSGTPPI